MHASNAITLLLFTIKLSFSARTPEIECTMVDAADRIPCDFNGNGMYECEITFHQATNRLCCYDDETPNSPLCFVAGEDTIESSNSGGTAAPGFPSGTTTPSPFRPTADLLGNRPPVGTVSTLFNTQNPNPVNPFLPGRRPPVRPNPGAIRPPTGNQINTNSPSENLQNLLESLGIENAEQATGPTRPSRPGVGRPAGPTPTIPDDVDRTVALCSYINNNVIPESILRFFEDVLSQCNTITTTVSPAVANAYIQREINNIIEANRNRQPSSTPSTSGLNPSNPLASLLGNRPPSTGTNPLGNLGGGSSIASLLGGGNRNPLSSLGGGSSIGSLLGGGNNNPLSSLGGGSSIASLLGGGNNNPLSSLGGGSSIANLLGGGNNNPLSSLGGSSSIASLLGGGNRNPLSSLGGGSSLASLLGGAGGGNNNPLSSLLGGGGSTSTANLLGSLLGGGSNSGSSGGSSNSLVNSLLLSQSFGRPGFNQQNQVIGSQLPNFVGTTPPPPYNPFVCQLLLGNSDLLGSVTGGSGLSSILGIQFRTSILNQNGCLRNLLGNPLLLLQGGGGIDAIRNSLGPLLGITTDTEEENIGNTISGALDPARIPSEVLTRCLNERDELNRQNNCKVGVYVNIRTELECLNIGCIFASGGMCFRCPYVTTSSQLNRNPEETCTVPTSDRQDCPGFSSTLLLTSFFSQQQLINQRRPSVATGGIASARSAEANSNLTSRVAFRQGVLGNLASAGGLGSFLGNQNPLASLGGGLGGGGLGGLSGIGGLGGGLNNVFLQRSCEDKGCCWDSSNNLFNAANSCYRKELPASATGGVDCLSSQVCGVSLGGILPRIIGGGTAISEIDRPWQVLIRLQGSSVVRCSGTIICSQWMVTSASCLQKIQSLTSPLGFALDLSPSSLEAIVTTINPASPFQTGQAIAISQIIPHPYYQVTQNYHNIALLFTPTLALLSVIPVCLPPARSPYAASGETFYVNGFGQATFPSTVQQSTLKEIPVVGITDDLCRTEYETSFPNSGVFCANPMIAGEDTCNGDGGSPALRYDNATSTFTLAGINFAGSQDCSGTKPLAFLDIAEYREWIRETTNGCCSILSTRLGK